MITHEITVSVVSLWKACMWDSKMATDKIENTLYIAIYIDVSLVLLLLLFYYNW